MSDLIPEGWKLHEIKDVALSSDRYSFTGGPFGSNLKSEDYTEEGVRIIQLQNIGDGEFKNKYKIYTSEAKADDLHSCNIYPNDIILSKMGDPVARATIIPSFSPRYLMASDGIRLSVDNSSFDTKFVHDTINSTPFRAQAELNSTGSTRKRIGLTELRKLEFIAPPLPEQQKIAAILSSVDEVIEKTQAQINKLKDLKTGMMQELLSPREGQAANINNPQGESKNGLHHTEFKDSPLGRIPVGWEIAKFKDVFIDYKYGPRFSSKDYSPNGNVKTIRGTDVANNGEIHYQQVPTAQIDADTVEAHKLKDGDLVMITTADCGASAVFREQNIPYIASAYAIKLTPTNKVIPAYIKFFMQTSNAMTQIESFIRKGTVANLPGSDVMNIELALPPIKSQEKISSILNALEDKIDLIIKKNTQLKHTKKALMQDLLTGKVRVKVDAA